MSHHLALNVRNVRKAAGLSQEQLAAQSGVSQNWISRLERGAANPTLDTLCRIAAALNMQPQDLFCPRQG